MAEEPQQKKFEVHSDEHKDRFSGMFPELVDNCTKLRQGSSEIGEAIQHIKLVSTIKLYTALPCTAFMIIISCIV